MKRPQVKVFLYALMDAMGMGSGFRKFTVPGMFSAYALALNLYAPAANAQAFNYEAPRASSVLRNNGATKSQIYDEDRPIGLYGSLSVSISKQQNVLRTDNNSGSDTVLSVSPLLWYQKEIGRHGVVIRYRGDYLRYADLSNENALDHNLQGDALFDLSEKFQARVGAGYTLGHEVRGQLGTVINTLAKPNRFRETSVEGGLTYGRRENTIQLVGTVGVSKLKYTNNNGGGGRGDIDTKHIGGTVFYNIGTRTSLLAEVGINDIAYANNSAGFDLDSKETYAGIGARWDATELTQGDVRIYKTKKNLDDPSRNDFSGTTYSGGINWAPRDYSRFRFHVAHSIEESIDSTSSFVIGDEYGLRWNHTLNSAWSVNAFAIKGTDEYSSGRKDQLTDFGLGANYGAFSWGAIGLQYTQASRTSNTAKNEFDDEIISLIFTSSFGA